MAAQQRPTVKNAGGAVFDPAAPCRADAVAASIELAGLDQKGL